MSILVIGTRAPDEYAALERELAGEHGVVVAPDVARGRMLLGKPDWALVVLDGGEFVRRDMLDAARDVPVVAVLARPTLEATLNALEAGVRDVQAPPLRADRLRDLAAARTAGSDAEPADPPPASALIVGESAVMLEVYRGVARAASLDVPVLLVGEAGTGKELFARVIHERSGRAGGPFVAVNLAAIPGHLLEAELFGGSPGAEPGKLGWIGRAQGGTLYLEELGALPGSLQTRLQRLVQPGRPAVSAGADVRVIAASDVDLQDAVLRQRFRGELYYAFAGMRIDVPPLRERGDDVRLIARHLLRELAGEAKGSVRDIDASALDVLQRYTWPGNIRQLRAVLARALAIADAPILRVSHLPPEIVEPAVARSSRPGEFMPLAELERRHIQEALKLTGGHLGQAARLLGIHRNTLRRKLEAFQLSE